MNNSYYININLLIRRALAFIIDLFICYFLGILASTIYLVTINKSIQTYLAILLGTSWLFLIIRDFILGKSVGKRIFGIVIIDERSSAFPKLNQLLIRNLFLLVSPIEVFFVIFSYRRIGDLAAKTVVINKRDIQKIKEESQRKVHNNKIRLKYGNCRYKVINKKKWK